MTSRGVDNESGATDCAGITATGFERDKSIFLAPKNERGRVDAVHIARDVIVPRCLKAAKCSLARSLHAREIPIGIYHGVVDDGLAYNCIIESFDHEHTRCHVKQDGVEPR